MKLNFENYVYGNIVYEAVDVDPLVCRDEISECDGCVFERTIKECEAAPPCNVNFENGNANIIWVKQQ